MDEVLGILKKLQSSTDNPMGETRVLTDLSGNFFTLVMETKAESMDAFQASLQKMFSNPEMLTQVNAMNDYFLSGQREYYNIEFEMKS
jgi:hypothetical protein